MHKNNIVLSSTIAVALLALGGTSIADSQLSNDCASAGLFSTTFGNPYEEAVRTATSGFSATTQEQPSREAVYLSAYIERPNGNIHPAFSSNEQRLMIFHMPSGKYVVRLIEAPVEDYWPGPY